MRVASAISLALSAASLLEGTTAQPSNGSLIIDEAPDFVRPYVLPKFKGRAVHLTPSQIIRFSVTGNSSDGAFSLVQHNGKVTGWTPARPHTHHITHEHFYCTRGRVQLWGQRNATNSSHEARVGTPGDYGSVPPNAIHTFQLTDPDSQLAHIFHPGGFEHLFDVFSGGDYDSAVDSPYPPDPEDAAPFGPLTPEQDVLLRSLDLYAAGEELFIPRRDFVNGSASDVASLKWHNGNNSLPDDPTEPYFIAKDYGPIYLNTEAGYKVIQPLATPRQSKNFTTGTIIMSSKLDNETVSSATLPHHFALQLNEGQLYLSIEGYRTEYLLEGDVAFIPANTPFTYYAGRPFTKFLYMNGGSEGLDHQLLKESIPWGFPAYPTYAGFGS